MSTEDQRLIDDCLSGRTEAFGQLVVRYQDRLYNTLVKMLGSPHDARDVAQEAFVQAFQKLGSFHGNSAFYSWLFRIAINAAVTQKRKQSRVVSSLDARRASIGAEPADTHPESRPSHELERAEQQELVQTALAALPEEFRTVLVLKEMESLKYEEIAKIVGCPVGTVRSRIHRARSELRGRLKAALKDS